MLSKAVSWCGIVGVVVLVSNAQADPVPVNSFKDLWGSPAAVRTVKSQFGDSLMIDHGGSIEAVGLDGSDWHMGFVDYKDGQTRIVGYARNAKKVLPGYEGWMYGQYAYEMNLDDDLKPDDVFIVQDVLGDGIGVLNDGDWMLGADDVFYNANDVLFGAGLIRGDVSQLPAYGSLYLPQMRISAFSGSIPGDLDGDGFVGLSDLDIVLNNWNQTVPPGDPSADPSQDGFVGLRDLDTVLGHWNVLTPANHSFTIIPEPTSATVLLFSLWLWADRRGLRR